MRSQSFGDSSHRAKEGLSGQLRMSGRVLVDSNMLIYASLSGDERHGKAKEVLDLRHRREIELCISVQNLAEMYPHLTGPKNNPPGSPEVARAQIDSIAALDQLTVFPLGLSKFNLLLLVLGG